MSKRRIVQQGEQDFINGVVKAIMKCDVSNEHYLLDYNGVLKYRACKVIDPKLEKQIDSGEVKARCIFEKSLIRNFHYKAGGADDLAKQWAIRSVKKVILHGKKTSVAVYGR
ncbi:hypothetical protein [Neobacillus jeddahensis]|uniref:hypothetical protein n=1 Tax=Neobacillus jeddahensis TaxID=1461580 RepID=UPI000590AD90|nr:hypothetical protein [Neobacillus jeddahensis]